MRGLLRDAVVGLTSIAVAVDANDPANPTMNVAARAFLTDRLGHGEDAIRAGQFWPDGLRFETLADDVAAGWYDAYREFSFPEGNGARSRHFLRVEEITVGDDRVFLFDIVPWEAWSHDARDLSERIRHLEAAQTLSHTGTWEWDVLTDDLRWSDETHRIFGLTPRAFDARYPTFLQAVHPDDRAMVEAALHRAVEAAGPYELEHRIIRPDGTVRFVSGRVEVAFSADGRPHRMLGAFHDVTELRAVQVSAARNRDMLSGLFRISPEAIIVADTRGDIIIFSAGAEAVFGYSASEIIGENVQRLMPERFRDGHGRHVEAFATGPVESLQMAQRRSISGLHKEGWEIPIEASLARVRAGGKTLFTTIVRDLSDRHEAEAHLIEARDQAQEANRAKSVFLANMSHELRTPLNGVLGVAGALARSLSDPRQKEMVALIEDSGRALQALLTDILDLAQVEAGRMEIGHDRFDLGAMVRNTAALFSVSARDKGLAFELTLADDACIAVVGDTKRIGQILNNLLSNAIKFTDHGRVALAVDVLSSAADVCWVRFSVHDSGIGFDDATKARLFDRFEQADSSITRRFGGTGLGLSICKALVDLMGGTIEARSRPGEGSTFSFALPLAPAPVADTTDAVGAQDGEPDEALRGRRPRILLAEDHPTNRRVVEFILDPLDVELVSVENGEEAVAAAASGAFDLILMDMQMPVMGGIDAVHHIRGQERIDGRHRTPICMLTANALPQHRALSLEVGADDFLSKPVSAEALIGKVVAWATTG
jgi:PAS domain S-box-containing protein